MRARKWDYEVICYIEEALHQVLLYLILFYYLEYKEDD
jgi:hypothetical protein